MLIPAVDSMLWTCLVGLVVYLATGLVLLVSRVRYERRMHVFNRVEALKHSSRALGLLLRMPIGDLKRLADDSGVSHPMTALLSQALLTRLGAARVIAAARVSKPGAARWRRIAALRTLAFAGHEHAWDCLARALVDGSLEVKAAAVVLLGQMGDRRSATLLVDALRAGSFSRSRIAAALEAYPADISDLVVPLLSLPDPMVRFWGTTLTRRTPQPAGLAERLVVLTSDVNPMVRKAAVDALVAHAVPMAVEAVRARLADEEAFVRAHAARSLGRMRVTDHAGALLPLLGDSSWIVRDAAKQALSAMGAAVVPSVLPCLIHPDAFARNGAAEVLQNMGVFDNLLMLEAVGPSDAGRVRILRQLADAGGAWMRSTAIERLGREYQPRARQLLESMGFERPIARELA